MSHAFLKAPGFAPAQLCNKSPFFSRRHAMKALRAISDSSERRSLKQCGSGVFAVYVCAACSHYHLGHK